MIQFCYIRLYLGIEIVYCQLLLWIAKMDMDWNLKKMHGPTFSSLNAMPAEITMASDAWWNVFLSFSFVSGVKALSYGFSTELT